MADFYDVLTIGNAIVDILTHVDDAFLEKAQLTFQNSLKLIDFWPITPLFLYIS